MINMLQFDTYVSPRNSIDEFEIMYESNGDYKTIYSGSKLASMQDDPSLSGEGHIRKTYAFESIKTKKIKIKMKTFVGEPSFYEIIPYFINTSVEIPTGDQTELKELVAQAEQIDPSDEVFMSASESLKNAFPYLIDETKQMDTMNQLQLDARVFYLNDILTHLGYGQLDFEELRTCIQKAEEEKTKEYTNDSLYYLQKAIDQATRILNDEGATQPMIDLMVTTFQEVFEQLEPIEGVYEAIDLRSGTGNWSVITESADNKDNYYTNTVGNKMTYHVDGSGVRAKGVLGADHGILRVTITSEGKPDEIFDVDCYRSNRVNNAILFEKELSNGSHTLTLELIGANASATNRYVEYSEIACSNYVEDVVDKSGLEALIKSCEEIVEDDYTVDSYQLFQEAFEIAYKVFESESTCNAEIKDTMEQLQTAIDLLVRIPVVDTTALVALLDDAKTMNVEGYTQESIEKLQVVIADVEAFLQGLMTQETVLAKTELLQQAMDALVVDKQALEDVLEKAEAIDESLYTADSVLKFKETYLASKAVFDDETSSVQVVKEAIANLDHAFTLLVLQSDTSNSKVLLGLAIQKAENALHDSSSEHLVPLVRTMIMARLSTAKTVYENVDASEIEILEAWLQLANGLHYLDFKADKTQLNMLVEECNAIDLSLYQDGVEEFKQALQEAKSVITDEKALQARIQMAYDNLMNAKHALVKQDGANKTMLSALISLIQSNLDETLYRHDVNWDTFVELLTQAEVMVKDDNASSTEVKTMICALTNAYENIRLLPSETLLKPLRTFIQYVTTLDMKNFTTEQVAYIQEVNEQTTQMLADLDAFEETDYAELCVKIDEVMNLVKKETTTPKDPSNNTQEETTLQDPVSNINEPSAKNVTTGDVTNQTAFVALALISGGMVYRLQRKRKQK